MKRNIIVIIFLTVLVGWGLMDLSNKNQTEPPITSSAEEDGNIEIGLEQGKLAPDFELETLDGETIKLSDFRGQKVILNLWATWCPPCRAEMPHMQDLYEDRKDEGFTIIAVNLTTAERNTEDIRPFIEDEFKLTFPTPLDVDGRVGEMYQAYSIPTSYIIDTQGRIQRKIIGPMSYEMMDDFINDVN
ncbi:peroxiredoxin family protein [Bacillus alkalisoli]|uniref:peroxiredoxin family protein n=1 Tax=Bacillus alkalisoli TaxID=2011008 RepID=UPI000C25150F|nr:TlpA disulfide reductase family protein [Bacillus alkalisoli]